VERSNGDTSECIKPISIARTTNLASGIIKRKSAPFERLFENDRRAKTAIKINGSERKPIIGSVTICSLTAIISNVRFRFAKKRKSDYIWRLDQRDAK
jgi:hypothetical protein